MTWQPSPQFPADDMYCASLPGAVCSACETHIKRREHRVKIRASWRNLTETLCPGCWNTVCTWAAEYALQQGVLDLTD